MKSSLANNSGLLLILLIALSPFLGYVTYTLFNRNLHAFFLLLGLAIVLLIFLEQGTLKMPSYVILFALFVVYTILSDLILVGRSIDVSYILSNRQIDSLLFLIVLENIVISRQHKFLVFRLGIFVLLVAFTVILIQQFYNRSFFSIPITSEDYQGLRYRLPSIFSWIEPLMLFGLCFMPLWMVITDEFFKEKRNFAYLFYLLGFMVAILNRTRITLVLFFLALIPVFIYRSLKLKTVLQYGLIIIISGIALFFILKSANIGIEQTINERYLEKSSGGVLQGSASSRLLAFKVFKELFPKNPLFGKGRSFKAGKGIQDMELLQALNRRSYQMHVGYLSLLYYYGIAGGLLFLSFLYLLFKKLFIDAKITGYWGPLIAFSMLLVNNFTDVVLFIDIPGIMLALYFNHFYVQDLHQKMLAPINRI